MILLKVVRQQERRLSELYRKQKMIAVKLGYFHYMYRQYCCSLNNPVSRPPKALKTSTFTQMLRDVNLDHQ